MPEPLRGAWRDFYLQRIGGRLQQIVQQPKQCQNDEIADEPTTVTLVCADFRRKGRNLGFERHSSVKVLEPLFLR